MKVTEIQVLERAIKDAMKGGLSKLDLLALLPPGHSDQHIMVMLYDHRFNKALWGDKIQLYSIQEDEPIDQSNRLYMYAWKWRLIEMTLSGDALAYIAKYKYNIGVR